MPKKGIDIAISNISNSFNFKNIDLLSVSPRSPANKSSVPSQSISSQKDVTTRCKPEVTKNLYKFVCTHRLKNLFYLSRIGSRFHEEEPSIMVNENRYLRGLLWEKSKFCSNLNRK